MRGLGIADVQTVECRAQRKLQIVDDEESVDIDLDAVTLLFEFP